MIHKILNKTTRIDLFNSYFFINFVVFSIILDIKSNYGSFSTNFHRLLYEG